MQVLKAYDRLQGINDTHDLMRAVRATRSHFFDPDTMRFFGSRLPGAITRGYDGRIYFVTSERRPNSNEPRLYTVRVFDGETIDDVGGFQAHKTLARARKAMYAAASKEA